MVMSRDKAIIFGFIVFLLLSLMDGALTLWGLRIGVIEEVNPLMLSLIENSPIVFIVVKASIPFILGFVLWRIRNKNRRFVEYSLGLILAVYIIIMAFHVYWMIIYFR